VETQNEFFILEKPRRPWLRWLKRLGKGLLIATIALAVRQTWHHREVVKKLEETLAELDRSDPGWRLEDIEAAREAIPEEKNSARVVVVAGSQLPKDWPPKEIAEILERYKPEEQLTREDFHRLSEELNAIKPALDEARKLADFRKGRHHIEYARDILGTLLKDQSRVPPITQLLLADAMRNEQTRRLKEAMIACRAALNAGRSLGDEPLAVTQMIRNRSVVWSCRCIERVLAQGNPPTDDLAALQKLLDDEDAFLDLLLIMRGERAAWHAMFDGLESGEASFGDRKDWEAYLSGPIFRERLREEHPLMLALMNRWLATAQLPPNEQADAEKRLSREAAHLPAKGSLTHALTPAFPKIGDSSRLKHALLRCTLAGLAVERYRHKHGKWPDSLDTLGPQFLADVPRDPFDGQPLRYRRLEDGVAIYSVGVDALDNGGNLDRAHPDWPGVDIGFRLWDVAKRRQPPQPKPLIPHPG
jgi:hypothetical protein